MVNIFSLNLSYKSSFSLVGIGLAGILSSINSKLSFLFNFEGIGRGKCMIYPLKLEIKSTGDNSFFHLDLLIYSYFHYINLYPIM